MRKKQYAGLRGVRGVRRMEVGWRYHGNPYHADLRGNETDEGEEEVVHKKDAAEEDNAVRFEALGRVRWVLG